MSDTSHSERQPEDVIWSSQQLLREPSPNYCEILTCLTFKGWITSGGRISTWNSGCTCSAQQQCSCSMPVSLQCALLSGAGYMLLQWCTILVHSHILDAGPPQHTAQIPRTRSQGLCCQGLGLSPEDSQPCTSLPSFLNCQGFMLIGKLKMELRDV